MLRSLNTVYTGLLGHQSRLDVIGNNIVNVNTTGYKSARTSFRALLGDRLGLDPHLTMGNGVGVASIDNIMNQGELEYTGIGMDLAIEGDGFFAVSLDDQQIYSRSGAFALDSEGRIIHLGSGGSLLGFEGNKSGVDGSGSLSELRVDYEQILPAEATTFLSLKGNLDINSTALGSVIELGPFLREAGGESLLTQLSLEGSGSSLGLQVGEQFELSAWLGDSSIQAEAFLIEETSTLANLASWIGEAIKSVDSSYPSSEIVVEGGKILLPGASVALENLKLEVEGNYLAEEAFLFPDLIEAGAPASTGGQATTLLVAADVDDALIDLYSCGGEALGGASASYDLNGHNLEFNLRLGGVLHSSHLLVEAETSLSDIMATIESMAGSSGAEETEVTWREDGSLLIAGQAGLDSEINNFNIRDADGELDLQEYFENREIQAARDSVPHTLSTEIVSASGERQHLALVFSLGDDGQGGLVWNWEAQVGGEGEIISGGRGSLVFSDDPESIPELHFEDGRSVLSISNGEGRPSQNIEILMDDEVLSVTQNDAAFDLGISGNDGVESGTLEDIQIDETGLIVGLFSNGETRDLARIALAKFRNYGGLERIQDNLYSESSDSGRPLWKGQASEGVAARIRSGTLERSNVDLSQEFAQMITTQKGFQANAKIVTVSDEMLIQAMRVKR
jgi:flagellar hook protein FlgE